MRQATLIVAVLLAVSITGCISENQGNELEVVAATYESDAGQRLSFKKGPTERILDQLGRLVDAVPITEEARPEDISWIAGGRLVRLDNGCDSINADPCGASTIFWDFRGLPAEMGIGIPAQPNGPFVEFVEKGTYRVAVPTELQLNKVASNGSYRFTDSTWFPIEVHVEGETPTTWRRITASRATTDRAPELLQTPHLEAKKSAAAALFRGDSEVLFNAVMSPRRFVEALSNEDEAFAAALNNGCWTGFFIDWEKDPDRQDFRIETSATDSTEIWTVRMDTDLLGRHTFDIRSRAQSPRSGNCSALDAMGAPALDSLVFIKNSVQNFALTADDAVSFGAYMNDPEPGRIGSMNYRLMWRPDSVNKEFLTAYPANLLFINPYTGELDSIRMDAMDTREYEFHPGRP